MNVNIDIDRILEAGAKAVDTAKKTATDLAKKLAEVCVIYAKGKEALAAEK